MSIIKKHNLSTGSEYLFKSTNPENDYKIVYWVDSTDSYFELKVTCVDTVTDEHVVNLWQRVSLDTLKQHTGFCDQSYWVVIDGALEKRDEQGDMQRLDVRTFEMKDVFADTLQTKLLSVTQQSSVYKKSLFHIFVPSADITTMETCLVKIIVDDNLPIEITGPAADSITADFTSITDHMSAISLTSPAQTITSDSSFVINIQTDPFISEVYIEPIVGQVNKTRVKMQNGSGKVTVFTNGLDQGEEVHIRAGFKRFTNIAQYKKVIS